MDRSARSRSVLLTGATGYVGGRLLRRLEADPLLRVRCLTRCPEALAGRVGTPTEVVCGDVFDPPSLARALRGVQTAYYLIHSMGARGDFEALDRAAATNFAAAARRAGSCPRAGFGFPGRPRSPLTPSDGSAAAPGGKQPDGSGGGRGLLDTLRGGVGLRRGRRDQLDLRVGDTVDFWRVERIEQGRLLRLAAEMKLPGRLWLQFEVTPDDGGGSHIRQTTVFDPAGYVGLAYWYVLCPVHHLIFSRMLRGIARAVPAPNPADRA